VCVRETGASGKPHYHAAIFENKDTFNGLGDYSKQDCTLGSYICKAWLSATGLRRYPEYRTRVSFINTRHILEALRKDR
ncbi:YagK/YfjJ domain-containing protein, partial [Citrobacter braakii]|uniref:YagK/YfjJ domain-containing protein n=1 Tax=Citrobacter braakii TaxID=57706 RepID=UPI002B24CEA1